MNTTTMKRMLLALLVLLVVAGGVYFYAKQLEQNVERASSENVAEWETYARASAEFQFQYPKPRWIAISQEFLAPPRSNYVRLSRAYDVGKSEVIKNPEIIITADSVRTREGNMLTPEEYLTKFYGSDQYVSRRITKVSVGGKEMHRVDIGGGSKYQTTVYLYFLNNRVYAMSANFSDYDKDQESVNNFKDFEDIIASFKVVK